MADIDTVRAALEVALGEIPGLQVGNHASTSTVGPQAVVIFPDLTYRTTFADDGYMGVEGKVAVLIVVYVFAQLLHDAVLTLDEFRKFSGDLSVRQAVETDRTLGLTGVDCVVASSKFVPLDTEGAFSAEFDLTAVIKKDT